MNFEEFSNNISNEYKLPNLKKRILELVRNYIKKNPLNAISYKTFSEEIITNETADIQTIISNYVINNVLTINFTKEKGIFVNKDDLKKGLFWGGIAFLFTNLSLPFLIAGGIWGLVYKIDEKITDGIVIEINSRLKDLVESAYRSIEKYENEKLRSNLTKEQLEVFDLLNNRGINKLVHFTSIENLNNILKFGLLSIKQLRAKKILYRNLDDNRLDGELDYISFSITNINKAYKRKHVNKNLVIFYMDANLLWKILDANGNLQNRIYSNMNAASKYSLKGSSISDFENMFANRVENSKYNENERFTRIRELSRSSNETTDYQAEILFKESIPLNYFTEIQFINKNDYLEFTNKLKYKSVILPPHISIKV